MSQHFQWGFCISFHLLNNGYKALPNKLVVPIATRRNMQLVMNTCACVCVCVCVCVKPTRIKVRYLKATSINAVNNVVIIDRNRFKVKMWACEHFREAVFDRQRDILFAAVISRYSFDGADSN
jgi:hypothetical protein